MTRKDYVLIANTIAKLNFTEANKRLIAERFAEALAPTNAAFKPDTFVAYCMKPFREDLQ